MTQTRKRRQKIIPGSIVQIDMQDGTFAFGQVLTLGLMAFFELKAEKAPPLREIADSKIAFTIWVMDYAIKRGLWTVIGTTTIAESTQERPAMFKVDTLSGALSITFTGDEEIPATLDEIEGLECAAVWDPDHVVERLSDHFAGRPNKWVESMRP